MAFKVKNLSARTRTFSFDFEGETAQITYNPNATTPRDIDDALEKVKADKGHFAVADMLARMVTTWDVLDENDEPWPLTPDAISELPVPFLIALSEAIQTNTQDRVREEGKASSGG